MVAYINNGFGRQMRPIALLRSSLSVTHVSGLALANFEQALASSGWAWHRPLAINRTVGRMVKLLYRLGLVRRLSRSPRQSLLVPMMGLQEAVLFPWAYDWEIIPIAFDCLPSQFDTWRKLFQRLQVDKGFFTASMVAEHFRRAMPEGSWHWLPESIDPSAFGDEPVPWEQRDIDVLEFGRRHVRYHDAVATGLKDRRLMHVFEKARGQLVFATRAQFVEGLSHSKVAICFPQSVTHPERFGRIETMTQRYLESMAAGAAVVGSAPGELIELFGYDPIIPVDWNDPVGQLVEIFRSPERHQAIRNRNRQTVLQVGECRVRARELAAVLARLNYEPVLNRPAGVKGSAGL